MGTRVLRLIRYVVGFSVALFLLLAVVTNVSTTVTSADEAVFRTILGLGHEDAPKTFSEEIAAIRKVQHLVLSLAPNGEPIPEFEDREPADLFRHRSGLCYDRSRTYDKVFTWLGMRTRHVWILYPEEPGTGRSISVLRAFFTYGTPTHAVTEVKTQRGWVLVDSNSAWISIDRSGEPVPAGDVYTRVGDFDVVPEYFKHNYIAIRGMYSRRGQFYRPFVPFPELNWPDFVGWLLE